jgi:hypothetical protein
MAVANNPTYKDATTITAVKSFTVQVPVRVLVKRPEDTEGLINWQSWKLSARPL